MTSSTLSLSRESRRIAGLLLLSITAVEFGGYYLTRVASGQEDLTDFQAAFSRAGHAHAGVLVTLSLIIVMLADAANLRGPLGYVGRLGVPAAAILMPTGFFLSSAAPGATEPTGWVVLLWLGGVCLAVGVVTMGEPCCAVRSPAPPARRSARTAPAPRRSADSRPGLPRWIPRHRTPNRAAGRPLPRWLSSSS